MMRLVVAVGGNAILDPSESMDYENQWSSIQAAASKLAELAGEHEMVIVHGNGPQVGEMLRHQLSTTFSLPLEVLVAQTQGQIGSMMQRALDAEGCDTVCVVTQVVVDESDPAFDAPSKPVGEYMDAAQVAEVDAEVKEFSEGWRRVVPSPEPLDVVESDSVSRLLETCDAVVAGGGGGVPVTDENDGVEAVVDKDRVAELLACELDADKLVILTDVPGVYELGEETAVIGEMGSDEVMDGVEKGVFEEGTIRPKLEAAAGFVEETGREAYIGSLADPVGVLSGDGTTVR